MIVKFRNQTLRKSYEDANTASREWGPQVARRYIQRIEQIEAMPNFHSLFSIQSLRLHPLKGRPPRAIRAHHSWALSTHHSNRDDASDTVLVSEVSNHYDN